jgi:uncharacterized protein with HEPN domain
MPKRHPELYITDILESGLAIQAYVRGIAFDQFTKDRMRSAAVIREFEIIGEAVGKVPDDLKNGFPDVPWRDIKDFRNLLTHEYFGIDLEIVWNTINQDLPLLLDASEKILANLSEHENPGDAL